MEKSNRPQRNRRHSRRAWPPEDDLHYTRPIKRLFTPEIKRMLKEWLVRRRENPYPSREEKKRLAIETGLTYTQICNWFANWRRKLKNSEREKSKKSWGHLIKHYNNNAKGNVEQFSISSEDSIWEEEEQQRQNKKNKHPKNYIDFYTENEDDSNICDIEGLNESTDVQQNLGCHNSSTRKMDENNKTNSSAEATARNKCTIELFSKREVDVLTSLVANDPGSGDTATKTKYKQKIMEKYLRDTNDDFQAKKNLNLQSFEQEHSHIAPTFVNGNNATVIKSGAELSKWLESAAKFTPNKNNYYIEWNSRRSKLEKTTVITKTHPPNTNSLNLQISNTTVSILPLLYSTSLVQRENSQDCHSESSRNYGIIHHKDELDAAEALANLAFNCRQKMLDSATKNRSAVSWPLSAISS